MDIYLIRYNDNKGIIRCNNLNSKKVIEILKSIKNISSNNIKIITLGTSGTIKGLINKHISKLDKLQKEETYNHFK